MRVTYGGLRTILQEAQDHSVIQNVMLDQGFTIKQLTPRGIPIFKGRSLEHVYRIRLMTHQATLLVKQNDWTAFHARGEFKTPAAAAVAAREFDDKIGDAQDDADTDPARQEIPEGAVGLAAGFYHIHNPAHKLILGKYLQILDSSGTARVYRFNNSNVHEFRVKMIPPRISEITETSMMSSDRTAVILANADVLATQEAALKRFVETIGIRESLSNQLIKYVTFSWTITKSGSSLVGHANRQEANDFDE